MREALQIVGEEGLQASWANHERLYHKLWDGLTKLGLEPFVEDENDRLVTVNTIKVYLLTGSAIRIQSSDPLQLNTKDNSCAALTSLPKTNFPCNTNLKQ